VETARTAHFSIVQGGQYGVFLCLCQACERPVAQVTVPLDTPALSNHQRSPRHLACLAEQTDETLPEVACAAVNCPFAYAWRGRGCLRGRGSQCRFRPGR
jgi:hypothetical protein